MDSDDDEHVTGRKITAETRSKGKAKLLTGSKKSKTLAKKPRRSRCDAFLDDDSSEEVHNKTDLIVSKPEKNMETTPDILKRLDDNLCRIPSPPISFGSRLNVPLHENKPLDWSHRVNLIGEKTPASIVHSCEICQEHILHYGRLIPCKHVFCHGCALQKIGESSKTCPRCSERVVRLERCSFPVVHMCMFDKCRRTYLSARDLHAHVAHRHTKKRPVEKNDRIEKVQPVKRSSLAASLEELSKQANAYRHSYSHSNYPAPSLHTIQWTAAVAASTSAQMKATAKNSTTNSSSSSSPWSAAPGATFNRPFYP